VSDHRKANLTINFYADLFYIPTDFRKFPPKKVKKRTYNIKKGSRIYT